MRQRGPQIGAPFKDGVLSHAPVAKLSLWYHIKCNFNKATNMHSRGSMEQHFYIWEPRCGYLHKVKKANGAIDIHSKGSNELLPKY